MKKIILRAKIDICSELNLKSLSRIDFNKNVNFIKKLKVLFANKEIKLEEIFNVSINKLNKKEPELIIYGLNKFCNFVGWRWENGKIHVKSNVGSYLGANMQGGSILVEGSAENFVGSELENGEILIKSNVQDFVGAPQPGKKVGMTGGTIIIKGTARHFLGLNMKKGLIYVENDVGDFSCNNMTAGTVILQKKIGKNFGNGIKRGTVVIKKRNLDKNLFLQTTNTNSSFFDFLNNFLKNNYGLKGFKKKRDLKRFFGDLSISGLGEVIVSDN